MMTLMTVLMMVLMTIQQVLMTIQQVVRAQVVWDITVALGITKMVRLPLYVTVPHSYPGLMPQGGGRAEGTVFVFKAFPDPSLCISFFKHDFQKFNCLYI